jgi:DNA-binding CsgD family transcriptional regulator
MDDLTAQPSKPLHIYFRDDMDTYMTLDLFKNATSDIDATFKMCKSWSELSISLSEHPTNIVFHIDMVQRHGGTIPEFMLMLETMMKYSGRTIKPNVGVGIEITTPAAVIKELQKHKILAIVPSALTFGAEYTNTAIKHMLASEPYWPKDIISKLPGSKKSSNKSNVHLTDRQTQVFDLIAARGLSNKQIARTLNISESTVKIHVSAIMKVLCVRNRTQLALTK